MSQPLEYEQAGYNGPDGLQVGKTDTDLVSFYGATPVAKPLATATVQVSTVSSQSTSSGAGIGFGFVTLVEYQNLVGAVSTMQYTFKQMGLIP